MCSVCIRVLDMPVQPVFYENPIGDKMSKEIIILTIVAFISLL